MATINIDFEVFKELTVRRKSETMTENDVIRDLLGLPEAGNGTGVDDAAGAAGAPWVTKGVAFPHGTEFRASYMGRLYEATVDNGALAMNGKRYTAPSAAAMAITGNPVNGWRFWECRLPETDTWRLIANLRG